MDTDSAYMALSAPLDEIVKEELRKEYYEQYGNWFPRPYCPDHAREFVAAKLDKRSWDMKDCCKAVHRYDMRTPGLFKDEFTGNGIIALNSKTYHCWSDENEKYSSKGLSKTTNSLTKDNFFRVLRSKRPLQGTNKGFTRVNHQTFSYSQLKTGLTYFYAKRKVCDDGVSTQSIDI